MSRIFRMGLLVLAMVVLSACLLGLYMHSYHSPGATMLPQPSFTFAAAGDFDATDQTVQVLETIKAQSPDFALALGDFGYDTVRPDEWCSLVHTHVGTAFPFELIPGNHDTAKLAAYQTCLPNRMTNGQGTYPAQYYFDHKGTRIIAIAPNLTIDSKRYDYSSDTSPDYQWLSQAIDQARQQKIRWVVVAMHENCLSIGEKTCEISPHLFKALIAKRVDLILQGHEHGYMRSKQLTTNADCPTFSETIYNPACALQSRSSYSRGQGPVLVLAGTGGVALRDIHADNPLSQYFVQWNGKNESPLHGAAIVQVSDNQLRVDFRDTQNKVRDSFVIY